MICCRPGFLNTSSIREIVSCCCLLSKPSMVAGFSHLQVYFTASHLWFRAVKSWFTVSTRLWEQPAATESQRFHNSSSSSFSAWLRVWELSSRSAHKSKTPKQSNRRSVVSPCCQSFTQPESNSLILNDSHIVASPQQHSDSAATSRTSSTKPGPGPDPGPDPGPGPAAVRFMFPPSSHDVCCSVSKPERLCFTSICLCLWQSNLDWGEPQQFVSSMFFFLGVKKHVWAESALSLVNIWNNL